MSHLRRVKVHEVMIDRVVTGRPDDSLSKIASQMERHNIGSVVIVQSGKVVGILTERDFVRIASQGILQGRDRAKDHMTKPVVTVKSEDSVADLMKLVTKKHVRHIPVLNRKRELVGMISSRDLMNLRSELFSP